MKSLIQGSYSLTPATLSVNKYTYTNPINLYTTDMLSDVFTATYVLDVNNTYYLAEPTTYSAKTLVSKYKSLYNYTGYQQLFLDIIGG